MDYQEIKDLINSTLQGKESGHEITPLEHFKMLNAVLDYVQQTNVTGQSILQGYAKPTTFPATPDDAKLCYIAYCKQGELTTFANFAGKNNQPISITSPAGTNKFVVLFWNLKYWDKFEQSPETTIFRGDFNQDFNSDFYNV